MKRPALYAAFILALTACDSGTPVVFRNASNYRLDGVMLSGSGLEASLGVVAPGQSLKTKIYPSGESGLAVGFIANGRKYGYGPQHYFEGGGRYKVAATVNHDLNVVVHSGLQP